MICRSCGKPNSLSAKVCAGCQAPLEKPAPKPLPLDAGPGAPATRPDDRPCPFCAEPIRPEAKRCRWCGQWLISDAERGAIAAQEASTPEAEEEAKELEGWRGGPPPAPVFSIGSYIASAFVLIFFGLGFVLGERDGFAVGCGLSILPAIMALVFVANDLALMGTRGLQTPDASARHFIALLKQRKFARAQRVCVTTPRATRRNVSFKTTWQSAAKSVGSNGMVNGGRVLGVVTQGDAAVVTLQIDYFSGSTIGCLVGIFIALPIGLLLYYLMGKRESVQLTKVLIRRGGRWWFVNGLPADRVDRQLASAMNLQ